MVQIKGSAGSGKTLILTETLEKQKKNVVYVAITRANSFLYIVADKNTPSEALQLLDKAVNNNANTES